MVKAFAFIPDLVVVRCKARVLLHDRLDETLI